MSEETDLEQLERQVQADAVQSVQMTNLPYVGPPPVGRWINIGIGRTAIMNALGLAGDEAASLLFDHLGKSVPFRFAHWSVSGSIRVDDFTAEPMINFEARDGAPDLSRSVYWSLFFPGENVERLQWSAGTFGGATGGRLRVWLSNRAVTFHEFTVLGTMIDGLAFHRALGLPHDEEALAIRVSSTPVSAVADFAVKNSGGGNGSAGRPRAGEGTWGNQLTGELLGRATGGGWMPGGPAAVDRGAQAEIVKAIHDWLSENNHEEISDTTAKLIAARLLLILREIRKSGG